MPAKRTPTGPISGPLDDESLAAGFRNHRDSVFRFLLRRTGHAERAEDLTQQVFLQAARDRPLIGGEEPPLLAWLYTVARRRFLDESYRPIGPLPDYELGITDDTVHYGREVAAAIRIALRQLTPEHRELLWARLLEGVPFSDLADRYGITEGAVKMRFSRGLRELQLKLERLGVEP